MKTDHVLEICNVTKHYGKNVLCQTSLLFLNLVFMVYLAQTVPENRH